MAANPEADAGPETEDVGAEMDAVSPDTDGASPDTQAAIVELDALVVQPGTYFNPQTEVLVIVDDSTSLDQEIFNMEAYEGADWVRISDDTPVDEPRRDELLEHFQTHYHPGGPGAVSETALEQDDGEEDEGENEHGQEPGRED